MATTEELEHEVNCLRIEVSELKELITGQQTETSYSVAQVATKLGLSTSGVNFHIRKGTIKAFGNNQRFKKIKESELNRYIATLSKPEAKA
jgi:Helix-turn-helix domain